VQCELCQLICHEQENSIVSCDEVNIETIFLPKSQKCPRANDLSIQSLLGCQSACVDALASMLTDRPDDPLAFQIADGSPSHANIAPDSNSLVNYKNITNRKTGKLPHTFRDD
jgi:hypothetical protein